MFTARAENAATHHSKKHRFSRYLFNLLLVLFASIWAPSALATIGCEIIAGAPAAINVAPGGSNTFTANFVSISGGCGTAATVTFTVLSDTTGGVALPPTQTGITTPGATTFTVAAGPAGGGTAVIRATCTTGCSGGATSADFTLNTNSNIYSFTNTSPLTVITNQIIPFTLSTNLQVNGTGSGTTYSTQFFSGFILGTPANDAAGNASVTTAVFTTGPQVITASPVCPPANNDCGSIPVIDFNVTVEAVSLTAITPATGIVNINAGSATTLVARYGGPTVPVPAGDTISWNIATSPAGGDGVISGVSTTNAAGNSQANFTATVPGTYTITASSGDTFSADPTETFTVIVTAITRTLVVSSGNNQTAPTGSTLPLALSVLAQDNGVNAGGITINWTTTAGTLSSATSVTNAAGLANIGLTMPAAAGPVTITATRADDAAVIASFTATATLVQTLTVASGNNQTAPTSTALPVPLVVLAQDNGANVAGTTINWTTTGGTLSAGTSVTNAAGQANIGLTLPATAGAVTITATRNTPTGPISTIFTATATLVRTLAIVSGNNQNGAPGAALPAPLVVVAQNNGTAIAGIPINWTISAGSTLANAVSATNAAGQATNTATLSSTPGVIIITAARQDDPTATVSFNVNSVALAGIANLTPQQRAIAVGLDRICASLSTLPAPTAAQLDFITRCNELNNNVATNPTAVTNALQALLPDTQSAQARSSQLTASRQFETINARIAALRSGTQGTSFEGLALTAPNGRSISLGALMKGLTENNATETPVGGDFQRWGFFASGTIGNGDANAVGITPHYDFDIKSLTLGLDYRYSDSFIFGGALGYNKQDTELTAGQGGVDAKSITFSAYGTYYRSNNWYTDAALTFGSNQYDLTRQITYSIPNGSGGSTSVNQTAVSDSDGDTLSFGITFGRDFQKGGWSIGPYGRILYTKLDFDRIEEVLVNSGPGAGLALVVEERSLDSLAGVLGAKFTKPISTSWGVLTPHIQIEWENEFNSDPGAVNARFLNDPTGTTITLNEEDYDSSYFRIGLGLSAIMAKGRSAFFYYDTAIGRDGIRQDNLALGLRLEF